MVFLLYMGKVYLPERAEFVCKYSRRGSIL